MMFRIIWSRQQKIRWYVRNVRAPSLAEALQSSIKHFQLQLGMSLNEFTVDHFVQEFGDNGQQAALHSLTKEPQKFSVYFNNRPWLPLEQIARNA